MSTSAVKIVVDALEVAELHRLATLGKDKDAADRLAVLFRFLQLGDGLLGLVLLSELFSLGGRSKMEQEPTEDTRKMRAANDP